MKIKKLIFILCLIPLLIYGCTDENKNPPQPSRDETPRIELKYTDILMLENNTLDIPITITPSKFQNEEIVLDIPSSKCATITVMQANDGTRYLHIVSNLYDENGNNSISGGTVRFKNYTSSESRKNFILTIYKKATPLTIPENLSYDSDWGIFKWDKVENARYYQLEINGELLSTSSTQMVLNESYYGSRLDVRIRAVYTLTDGFKDFTNSDFSNKLSLIVLNKPENLSHENGVICWDKVNNAVTYSLYISTPSLLGGNRVNERVINGIENPLNSDKVYYSGYTFSSATTYTIKVKANGDSNDNLNSDVKIYGTQYTDAITIIKLTAPNTISFNQGKLTWDNIPSNAGYGVQIEKYDDTTQDYVTNGNMITLSKNVNEFIFDNFDGQISNGEYKFSVYTLGDSKNSLSSDNSIFTTSTKLPNVTNVRIENGIVCWNNIDLASYYEIYLNDGVGINLGNVTSYALNSSDIAGSYDIEVVACGDGITYYNSNRSDVLSTIKLNTATLTITNGDTLIWNKIEGATNYIIYFNNEQIMVNGDASSYVLTDSNITSGEYSIKIMAVGNNVISSNYSDTHTYLKLATPRNLRVENGILVWDSVDNATKYILKYQYNILNEENIVEQVTNSVDISSNKYTFERENSANYIVNIVAVGGGSTIKSSKSQDMDLYKLPTPSAPQIDQYGKLICPEYQGGTLMVKIGNQEVIASNFSAPIKENVTMTIYAKGNNGENGENLISSSQSEELTAIVVGDLPTPTISNGYLNYSFGKGVTGIAIDFYPNGSLNSVYRVTQDKEGTTEDFKGQIQLSNIILSNLDTGVYVIKITPVFSPSTTESNEAYIYNGSEIKFTIYQLDRPENIGIYSLNNSGVNAISSNMPINQFNELIKNENCNKYSGYLYWTAVKRATAYALKINNDDSNIVIIKSTDLLTTSDGMCLYRLDENYSSMDIQGYQFSVRALGDDSVYFSGQYSNTTDKRIKLSGVGTINVINGELQWESIPNAFYEVSYNSNIAYTYNNTFALPGNAISGQYNISVRALPTSSINYAGEYSTRNDIIKINSPQTFYIYGGKVRWQSVTNASKYIVTINDKEFVYNINDVFLDLSNLVNQDDDFILKTGEFNISIQVIGSENSTTISNEYYYLSSSVVNLSTTILNSPRSLYVENGKLVWEVIEGAKSYQLSINNSANINKNVDVSGNSFVLDEDYSSGEYDFSIIAIGDGSNYISSSIGTTLTATKLNVVDNVDISNGNLVFNSIIGASSYNALINEYNTSNYSTENFNNTTFELNENYDSGKYQIKIQAVGNTVLPNNIGSQICYISSDYSKVISGYSEIDGTQQDYVYKLPSSNNMYIAEDLINWSKVTNASGYNIKINQATVIKLGDESSFELKTKTIGNVDYTFNSGTYELNVQALGGNHYLNSKYRTSDVTAVKLENVIDLGVENGVVSWSKLNDIPNALVININGATKTLSSKFFESYDASVGGSKGGKSYFVLGDEYESANYSITITNAGGGTTQYISSEKSNEILVHKLASPTELGIDSSSNAIVWEMNDDATTSNDSIKYLVKLYELSTNDLVRTFETIDELNVVLSSLDVGQYYIKIETQVISSSQLLLNSNASLSYNVTMPDRPTGLKIENGVITWTKIDGVSGYNLEFVFYEGVSNALIGNPTSFRITIDNSATDRLSIKDFTNDSTFKSISTLGYHCNDTALGKYQVKINAYVADSLQSNYSNMVGDNSASGVNGYYLFDMFSGGKGTTDSPYTISNFEQIKNISYMPDLSYKQIQSISTGGATFTPLGTKDLAFSGTYDGNNLEISSTNIAVSNVETDLYVGMFGYIASGGVVKNMVINTSTISQGYYVGSIAGYNAGTIYNVKVLQGNIQSTTKTNMTTPKAINIGGIVGYNAYGGIVDRCTYYGYVRATETISTYISYSGGICGYNYGTVCQCLTYKNEVSDNVVGIYAGGIVGYNINTITYIENPSIMPFGSVYKCGNNLDIMAYSIRNAYTSTNAYGGGIVGINVQNIDAENCVINNYSVSFCYSIGDVVGNTNGTTGVNPYVGGLVGSAGNGMYSCYVMGAVYGIVNGENVVDTTYSSTAPVHTGRLVGNRVSTTYGIGYCYYNVLSDELFETVGSESKLSRTSRLVVDSTCEEQTTEYFSTIDMVNKLNSGLISNGHDAIWSLDTLPKWISIDERDV